MPDEPDPRVEIVWNLAQSQLAAQVAAVDELRARVGTLIAGAAIATGFLAGQALDTRHGVSGGAWVGIGGACALLLACVIILWPRKWAGQSVDTPMLFVRIGNKPGEPVGDFQRYMAGKARTHFETNRKCLKWLYWIFSAALVFLATDFGGWIWVLTHQ